MSENKDVNLVAKKALELIKSNSNNTEEYKNNLMKSIILLGDELKKELKTKHEKPSKTTNEKINTIFKEKNAKEIYEMIKSGNSEYDVDTLIDAIIKTGHAEYILCSVALCDKVKITRKHFLKCAQELVDLRDVECIIQFSNHCTGTYTSRNTFDIMKELIKMIRESNDEAFANSIVEKINTMWINQKRRGKTIYTPFGDVVSTEMWKFKTLVEKINFNKKSEV